MSATCQTCHAPMLWLKNDRTGKPAPIDLEPNPAGNIHIDRQAGTYTVLPKEQLEHGIYIGNLYTNHWATCPDREAWKAKRPPIRLSGGS